MIKPPIVHTDSRHIPVAIQRYVFWRDGGECVTPGCDCRDALQYDHVPCWNTMPKGQRFHDPDKIFLRCKPHHDKKSAVDTSESAKSKRIGAKDRREWRETKNPLRSNQKLQGRGFQKDGPKRKIQGPGFQKKAKRK